MIPKILYILKKIYKNCRLYFLNNAHYHQGGKTAVLWFTPKLQIYLFFIFVRQHTNCIGLVVWHTHPALRVPDNDNNEASPIYT